MIQIWDLDCIAGNAADAAGLGVSIREQQQALGLGTGAPLLRLYKIIRLLALLGSVCIFL